MRQTDHCFHVTGFLLPVPLSKIAIIIIEHSSVKEATGFLTTHKEVSAKRLQAISWNNDDPVYQCICSLSRLNELNWLCIWVQINQVYSRLCAIWECNTWHNSYETSEKNRCNWTKIKRISVNGLCALEHFVPLYINIVMIILDCSGTRHLPNSKRLPEMETQPRIAQRTLNLVHEYVIAEITVHVYVQASLFIYTLMSGTF